MKIWKKFNLIVKGSENLDCIIIDKTASDNSYISLSLKELFKNIKDGVLEIDYLRSVYRRDINEFLKISQELSLRGCAFNLENPNNMFTNISNYEDYEYIHVKDNKNRYKHLKFDSLKVGNIIQKFNIEDDRFFNGISLIGFAIFNKNLDIIMLKEIFKECGFELLTEEKYKHSVIINEKNNKSDEEGMSSLTEIEKCFKENAFKTFREFCKINKITLLSEVNKEVIEKYAIYPSVGKGKVDKVKARILEIGDGHFVCEVKFVEETTVIDENTNVSQVFTEDKYKNFVDFCNDNNVFVLKEISEELILGFSRIRGNGAKKIEYIRDRIKKYVDIQYENLIYSEDEPLIVNDYWFSILKNRKLTIIGGLLKIENPILEELSLGDIANKTLKELSITNNSNGVVQLLKHLNKQLSIIEILNKCKESLKNIHYECLKYRYEEALTLEQIGKNYNRTRERIRQVIKKGEDIIFDTATEFNLLLSLKLNMIGKSSCSTNELYTLAGKDNYLLAEVIIRRSFLNSNKELNIIYLEDFSSFEEELEQCISKLPAQFKIYDELDNFLQIFYKYNIDEIELEQILSLLVSRGYREYGEYLSLTKITIVDAYEIIFNDYVDEPLLLDDNGLEHVKMLAQKYLDIVLDVKIIKNKIYSISSLVAVNKSTIIHLNKSNIDSDMIKLVDEILVKELKEVNKVSSYSIYEKYEEILVKIGISNKYHFYAIVKSLLSDKYITGRGNTMEISKSLEELKVNREEMILDIINRYNGRATRDEILSHTEWPKYKLEDTLSKSNKILKVGDYITSVERLKITEVVKNIIINYIETFLMTDGFIVTPKIYDDLIIEPEVYDFFEANDIKGSEALNGILKYIYPKIKGNTYFLVPSDSKYNSFIEVLRDKFYKGFSKDDIKDTLDAYSFKRMTLNSLINILVTDYDYIKVSVDEYLNKEDFNISEEIIVELKKYIDEEFNGEEYLSLNTLTGYRTMLPSINIKWNINLIESILVRNGYRKINRIFADANTERLIIVKEDSKISRFDELVYYILKNHYQGNMHESKIFMYLVELGIVYNQENRTEKKMPFDIYKSDKFVIDEYGRVELV